MMTAFFSGSVSYDADMILYHGFTSAHSSQRFPVCAYCVLEEHHANVAASGKTQRDVHYSPVSNNPLAEFGIMTLHYCLLIDSR